MTIGIVLLLLAAYSLRVLIKGRYETERLKNEPGSVFLGRFFLEFGYWCFDPAKGEKPAEPSELCGDHWTRVVNLSNEWQFYTVPFTSMAQQGWAKRSAGLDLTSVSVVRFTWDGGWIDFWIDDVRFYKTKPK